MTNLNEMHYKVTNILDTGRFKEVNNNKTVLMSKEYAIYYIIARGTELKKLVDSKAITKDNAKLRLNESISNFQIICGGQIGEDEINFLNSINF